MNFNNLLTLVLIVGMGYLMFRGGGCCGSHGGHTKRPGDGAENGDENTRDDRTAR